MKTNLREYNNVYYRVMAPFEVLILVGISESNTFVGRSQMLGNVYRRHLAEPGDEVHALHGGTFLVLKRGLLGVLGEAFETRIKLDEWHPFEGKYHTYDVEQWPLDKLEVIEATQAMKPSTYRPRLPTVPPGKPYGRSIDSID